MNKPIGSLVPWWWNRGQVCMSKTDKLDAGTVSSARNSLFADGVADRTRLSRRFARRATNDVLKLFQFNKVIGLTA